MTKFLIVFSCLLCLSVDLQAQKSVSDLPPAHGAAVEGFLAKHPDLEFLSERQMKQEILKDMRKNFGARLTPYYRAGDFNRDGIPDFASVLVKKGPPTEDLGSGIAETHRHRHSLTLVIFNGQKSGGFKAAFVENTTGPLVSFLNVTTDRRKRLYFAVYETDEHMIMSPSKTGYVVEYK